MKKSDWLDILENAMAWTAALSMIVYGVGKFMQFPSSADLQTPVSQLTDMQLMWAFYGRSLPFALVIGALEIAGGGLLIFKKTRLLGGLLLTTVLVNIIMQDIFYGVNQGALIGAIIYQILIFGVFFMHREKLMAALRPLLSFPKTDTPTKKLLLKLLLSAIGVFVFKFLERLVTH